MQQGTSNSAMCAFFSWGALALLMAALHRDKRSVPAWTHASPASPSTDSARTGDITPIWRLEKEAIISALEKVNGDKLLAAKKLGIGKTTLYRKVKKYGISVEGTFRVLEPQRRE